MYVKKRRQNLVIGTKVGSLCALDKGPRPPLSQYHLDLTQCIWYVICALSHCCESAPWATEQWVWEKLRVSYFFFFKAKYDKK